jgi:hypothetical protein
MGVGPNYGLDKGFVATGGVAYDFGRLVVQSGTTGCAIAGAGGDVLGVCQEDIDASKVATGKAVIDIRLTGLSRVIAGAAVSVGARLASDASGRAVTAGTDVGSFGIARTAATAANQHIDVQLTPGARSAPA